jgi:aerobic-type carbon monoxide dehydrogenase small subunit (CoxS/CutS family)
MLKLNINGKEHVVTDAIADDTPLLWVLRDHLSLRGTKFGCGGGFCGACTVHLNGVPTRSCQLRAVDVAVPGMKITTIEGLAASNGALHALQQAWIDHDVPQCGYCQAGQLMSAAALLHDHPKPSDPDIDAAMSGNLCRCGTYQRIRAAIHSAAAAMRARRQP